MSRAVRCLHRWTVGLVTAVGFESALLRRWAGRAAIGLMLGAGIALPAWAAGADFCWKDSYGRGAGTVPQACAPDQERVGLLCYPRCGPGTTRVGTDCHSVCPSGLRDDGLFCRAAEYGRGAGYPWKFGDPVNDSGMLSRCQAENPGGCEMSGAIAYPKCRPGFRAVGCCVCRPEVPDCAALGLNAGVDLSCAKRVAVGSPAVGTCASGEQRDAGLCYAGCKASYSGVGPVCWGQCPASHPVSCAAGCAKTQAACAQATTDQVLSVLEVVANVGVAVATAGAGTAATAGAKAGVTAGKVAMTQGTRFAARVTRQQAIDVIRKQAKEAGKELSQAALETYADAVVQAGTTGEFDPAVLAGLDPTGVASVVVAYAKPVCTAPTEAAMPTATRVAATTQWPPRSSTGVTASTGSAASAGAAGTTGATTTPATAGAAAAIASPPVVAAAPSTTGAAPAARSGTVSLLGANGKFVAAEPNGRALADRAAAGPWERFVMEAHPDGTVSFRSAHGRYLVAEANGSVAANREAAGPWEKFSLVRQPGGAVLLKTAHGTFLTAQPDGRLTAGRRQAGAAELFTLR